MIRHNVHESTCNEQTIDNIYMDIAFDSPASCRCLVSQSYTCDSYLVDCSSDCTATVVWQFDTAWNCPVWNACFEHPFDLNRLLLLVCSQRIHTHAHCTCMLWAEGGAVTNQSPTESQPLFRSTHTHTHDDCRLCAPHNICMIWCTAMFALISHFTSDGSVSHTHTHTRSHWIFVRPKRMRANEQKERWKTSRVPEISKNKPMPVAHIHNRKQIIVLVVSHPSTMPMCHLPLALNFITAHSNTHRNKLSLYIFQQIRTRHTSTKALNTNYNYNL